MKTEPENRDESGLKPEQIAALRDISTIRDKQNEHDQNRLADFNKQQSVDHKSDLGKERVDGQQRQKDSFETRMEQFRQSVNELARFDRLGHGIDRSEIAGALKVIEAFERDYNEQSEEYFNEVYIKECEILEEQYGHLPEWKGLYDREDDDLDR